MTPNNLKKCPICHTPVEMIWPDGTVTPCLCDCATKRRDAEHLAKRRTEAGIPARWQGISVPHHQRARKFLENYEHGDWTVLLKYKDAHLDAIAIANKLVANGDSVIFQDARHPNCSAWHMHRVPYLVIINTRGNEDIVEWRHLHNMTTIIAGKSKFVDIEIN